MSEIQRKRPRLLVWALVAALLGTPTSGRAGTMTGGATEWTQIANNIQLVLQYVQQIIDYTMQVKHLVELSKMTALFKDPRNTLAIGSMFTQLLAGLNQVVFSGKSLAEQWRRSHPGEQEPSVAGYRSISEAYTSIDKDLNRAAEQSLKALDIYVDPKTVRSEQEILDGLKSKMQQADGEARIAQVANELLFEIIRQLTLLRQVLLVQARMSAEGISAESQMRLYKRVQKARDYQYRGRYRATPGVAWSGEVLGGQFGSGVPASSSMPASGGAGPSSVLGNGVAPAPGSSGGDEDWQPATGPRAPAPGSRAITGGALERGPGAAPAPGSSGGDEDWRPANGPRAPAPRGSTTSSSRAGGAPWN